MSSSLLSALQDSQFSDEELVTKAKGYIKSKPGLSGKALIDQGNFLIRLCTGCLGQLGSALEKDAEDNCFNLVSSSIDVLQEKFRGKLRCKLYDLEKLEFSLLAKLVDRQYYSNALKRASSLLSHVFRERSTSSKENCPPKSRTSAKHTADSPHETDSDTFRVLLSGAYLNMSICQTELNMLGEAFELITTKCEEWLTHLHVVDEATAAKHRQSLCRVALKLASRLSNGSVSDKKQSFILRKTVLSWLESMERNPGLDMGVFCDIATRCIHQPTSAAKGQDLNKRHTSTDGLNDAELLRASWSVMKKRLAISDPSQVAAAYTPLLHWSESVFSRLERNSSGKSEEVASEIATFFVRECPDDSSLSWRAAALAPVCGFVSMSAWNARARGPMSNSTPAVEALRWATDCLESIVESLKKPSSGKGGKLGSHASSSSKVDGRTVVCAARGCDRLRRVAMSLARRGRLQSDGQSVDSQFMEGLLQFFRALARVSSVARQVVARQAACDQQPGPKPAPGGPSEKEDREWCWRVTEALCAAALTAVTLSTGGGDRDDRSGSKTTQQYASLAWQCLQSADNVGDPKYPDSTELVSSTYHNTGVTLYNHTDYSRALPFLVRACSLSSDAEANDATVPTKTTTPAAQMPDDDSVVWRRCVVAAAAAERLNRGQIGLACLRRAMSLCPHDSAKFRTLMRRYLRLLSRVTPHADSSGSDMLPSWCLSATGGDLYVPVDSTVSLEPFDELWRFDECLLAVTEWSAETAAHGCTADEIGILAYIVRHSARKIDELCQNCCGDDATYNDETTGVRVRAMLLAADLKSRKATTDEEMDIEEITVGANPALAALHVLCPDESDDVHAALDLSDGSGGSKVDEAVDSVLENCDLGAGPLAFRFLDQVAHTWARIGFARYDRHLLSLARDPLIQSCGGVVDTVAAGPGRSAPRRDAEGGVPALSTTAHIEASTPHKPGTSRQRKRPVTCGGRQKNLKNTHRAASAASSDDVSECGVDGTKMSEVLCGVDAALHPLRLALYLWGHMALEMTRDDDTEPFLRDMLSTVRVLRRCGGVFASAGMMREDAQAACVASQLLRRCSSSTSDDTPVYPDFVSVAVDFRALAATLCARAGLPEVARAILDPVCLENPNAPCEAGNDAMNRKKDASEDDASSSDLPFVEVAMAACDTASGLWNESRSRLLRALEQLKMKPNPSRAGPSGSGIQGGAHFKVPEPLVVADCHEELASVSMHLGHAVQALEEGVSSLQLRLKLLARSVAAAGTAGTPPSCSDSSGNIPSAAPSTQRVEDILSGKVVAPITDRRVWGAVLESLDQVSSVLLQQGRAREASAYLSRGLQAAAAGCSLSDMARIAASAADVFAMAGDKNSAQTLAGMASVVIGCLESAGGTWSWQLADIFIRLAHAHEYLGNTVAARDQYQQASEALALAATSPAPGADLISTVDSNEASASSSAQSFARLHAVVRSRQAVLSSVAASEASSTGRVQRVHDLTTALADLPVSAVAERVKLLLRLAVEEAALEPPGSQPEEAAPARARKSRSVRKPSGKALTREADASVASECLAPRDRLSAAFEAIQVAGWPVVLSREVMRTCVEELVCGMHAGPNGTLVSDPVAPALVFGGLGLAPRHKALGVLQSRSSRQAVQAPSRGGDDAAPSKSSESSVRGAHGARKRRISSTATTSPDKDATEGEGDGDAVDLVHESMVEGLDELLDSIGRGAKTQPARTQHAGTSADLTNELCSSFQTLSFLEFDDEDEGGDVAMSDDARRSSGEKRGAFSNLSLSSSGKNARGSRLSHKSTSSKSRKASTQTMQPTHGRSPLPKPRPRTQQEIRSILQFSASDGLEGEVRGLDQLRRCLPRECVVVGMTLTENRDGIVLSRIRRDATPVAAHAVFARGEMEAILSEMESIRTAARSTATTAGTDAGSTGGKRIGAGALTEKAMQAWWEGRRALDDRIKILLDRLEDGLGWTKVLLAAGYVGDGIRQQRTDAKDALLASLGLSSSCGLDDGAPSKSRSGKSRCKGRASDATPSGATGDDQNQSIRNVILGWMDACVCEAQQQLRGKRDSPDGRGQESRMRGEEKLLEEVFSAIVRTLSRTKLSTGKDQRMDHIFDDDGTEESNSDTEAARDCLRVLKETLTSCRTSPAPDDADSLSGKGEAKPRKPVARSSRRTQRRRILEDEDLSDGEADAEPLPPHAAPRAALDVPSDERVPVVLVLDGELQCLPWECLPCLSRHPVTRSPSLHFVAASTWTHGEIENYNSDHGNNSGCSTDEARDQYLEPTKAALPAGNDDVDAAPPVWPEASRGSGSFVLNPGGDLRSTEDTLKPVLDRREGWTGVCGSKPSPSQFAAFLEKSDIFIYCGHGAGEAYMSGSRVRQVCARATTVLMGCSSGALAPQGIFDPHGICVDYLVAGCPAVVANLWDVTDRDIDRFSMDLVRRWLDDESQSSLATAIARARGACKLPYLIGAAPVCYGVPVLSSS